jgi:hypothetical protein
MAAQYEYFRGPGESGDKRDEGQARRLYLLLSGYTMERLADFHRALTGLAKAPGPKARLAEALAELFDLQTQEEFAAFSVGLPPHLREALARGVTEDWIGVAEVEKGRGSAIVRHEKMRWSYESDAVLVADARLGFFRLDGRGEWLALEGWIRELLLPFVPKPRGWEALALPKSPRECWSVAEGVTEILPLFRAALRDQLAAFDPVELARKGLKKRGIAALRAASGIPAFGRAAAFGLDSAEHLARFLALFGAGQSAAEKDTLGFIKAVVEDFFQGKKAKAARGTATARHDASPMAGLADSYYEQAALLDHLTRRAGYQLPSYAGLTPARGDFHMALDLLEGLWQRAPGAWMDAGALFDCLRYRLASFRFTDLEVEPLALGVKADSIRLEAGEIQSDPYESFIPVDGPLRRYVVARPLFEGYVYLFAALGLLEIAEAEPALRLLRKGKTAPISAADCLSALRLTPLGRFCLGYCAERPERQTQFFEAIADSELLVVTFRGSSLERRLYLNLVATPLGEERWRFTEARFIEGCETPEKIDARIADFRRLIESEPSARWRAFFAGIKTRAAVLTALEAAVLLPLPADPEIRRIFTEHPRIRALVRRVEDGSVVVRADELPALCKLLASEGFWAPQLKRPGRKRGDADFG